MVASRTEAEKIQDQTGASVISESKNVLQKRKKGQGRKGTCQKNIGAKWSELEEFIQWNTTQRGKNIHESTLND